MPSNDGERNRAMQRRDKRQAELARQGKLLGLKDHLAFVEDLLETDESESGFDFRLLLLRARIVKSRDETRKRIEEIEGSTE